MQEFIASLLFLLIKQKGKLNSIVPWLLIGITQLKKFRNNIKNTKKRILGFTSEKKCIVDLNLKDKIKNVKAANNDKNIGALTTKEQYATKINNKFNSPFFSSGCLIIIEDKVRINNING